MPAISVPATILVTGVNGYIGVHVAKSLLCHGYAVRGVVRSESQGQPLKELFTDHGARFSYIVVPDINAPRAFDDAVKDVTGGAHLRTPMPHGPVADVQDLIRPAVDGTINLLKSIQQHGRDVRRFVLTSSAVTVLEPKEGEYTYTEANWFDTALKIVESKGAQAHSGLIYRASKIIQERAATPA